MTDPKSAWLAGGLLAAISVVALAISLLLGPTVAEMVPTPKAVEQKVAEQKTAETEPVDGVPPKPSNGLELLARAVVNPDPTPVPTAAASAPPPPEAEVRPDPPPALRGAEPVAEPAPTAAAAAIPTAAAPVAAIPTQPWNDARADIKATVPVAPPVRKPRDARAEPHGKRARAAANNRACAPSNSFAGWLRKLNLGPRCTS
jgi:hypothetical protein